VFCLFCVASTGKYADDVDRKNCLVLCGELAWVMEEWRRTHTERERMHLLSQNISLQAIQAEGGSTRGIERKWVCAVVLVL
jgi:hypothetical protein